MKTRFFRILASGILLLSLLLSLLPSVAFAAKVSHVQEQASAVSVPSISSPFTTHPTVFIVEDTYQIAFATNATGIAWVEINGMDYQDSQNGLVRWNSKYHKITVPQSALNAADSYKICFRSLSDRPSYDPVPGSTVSRTYPFDPIPEDRDPVFYCSSDQHGTNTNNLKISKTRSFDVHVFGGDYISTLTDDSGIKLLLDMTGSVTQGRKPTIYTRGNHEIRGSNCEDIYRVSGYSEKTGPYYTVKLPGIFGIVLDAGEDKVDSHSEYGGTVQFTAYREAQTQWLRKVVASREWEKYPVRMAFAHVPFSFYAQDTFESTYKEWAELCDQMGISLLVSGHKHNYAVNGPNSSKHKADPNFTTLIMSDRENDVCTYSGTFLTVSPSEYKIENVQNDLVAKETKLVPVFTNAYVAPDASSNTDLATYSDADVIPTLSTKASVPSISSPYALHPTVFAVEDSYQIIFTTESTGMAWATVGGKKYYDQDMGLMNYTSKYHSIRVPRVALDTARSYTVSYQSMVYREAYSPTHGSTVSRTYPFTPIADKNEPVILCLSDFRSLATEAKNVGAYKSFDALFIGGDYGNNGNSEGNVRLLLDTASALTQGTKPVIFTRGNREIRGSKSYLLPDVAPSSPDGRSYYTIEQPGFFGIVLDSGEDKLDNNSAYGGTVDYETHRKEQTQWLKEVLAEGKWKDYPTRVAFCHFPITRIDTPGLMEDYAQWTELLNQMGISLLISGHFYEHNLFAADDSGNISNPNFPTLISCDVENTEYTYSGTYLTLGTETLTIQSVSAAKKLLKTSTTPNRTAPDYPAQSDPYLMFDFHDDSLAQDRYHSSVYGGVNFDLKGNWDSEANTTASAVTRGVLSFSPTTAAVTAVGIHSRPQGSAKNQWAYRPLHYFPKNTDYCLVRFKIDNAVAVNADGMAKFRLDVDCPNDLDDSADTSKLYTRFEQSFRVADVEGKGYVTLCFPLNTAEYNRMTYLNLVHPQFVDVKSASGATAVFSIDYIYIGPEEFFPTDDNFLFFGFDDTASDRERYNSFTYNYLNFDDPTNWIPYDASPMTSISDGVLRLAVPTYNYDTSHSVRSHKDKVRVLHYVPGENDILQVRIQINNAVASTEDGIVSFCMNLDRSNSLVIADGSSRTWTPVPIDFPLADYVDQGWFTLEVSLTDPEYLASDWINLVHPKFQYITSATGKNAEFLIDYIYIGPREKSPTAAVVTFADQDGTVLQQQTVAPGGTAVYNGDTPTKTYDADQHYIFAGWVNEDGIPAVLDNIQGAMTVYASFEGQAHRYTERIVTSATCTEEGQKEFLCSCGYSYLEAIPLEGHTPTSIAAVPATCTTPGMNEGSYCAVCKAILIEPTEIPALGHDPETVPGKPATCISSGLSDGSVCGVCGITLAEQEILPRLGHDMHYTNSGTEHVGQCSRCSKTQTEAHNYTNGTCICGATESGHVTEDNTLKLNHTLNLASDISVTLAIPKHLMEGFDMDTVYVLSELEIYQGNTLTGTKIIKLLPVEQEYYYYFILEGLTAVNMNDTFRSVLYGSKNGKLYHSPTDEYSIADYAYSQLKKTEAAEALKDLCAELLRYGAAAQSFKNYRTDALADGAMTPQDLDRLTNLEEVIFGNTNRVMNDLKDAPVTWAGKVLNLESKVELKFVFDPGIYVDNISALTLRIAYTDVNGQAKTLTLEDAKLYNDAMGVYAFTLDRLLAAELRSVISAQVYAGDTPVSCTLQYSPDTYGNGKTGLLLNLCKALFAYSDSAMKYFTS